MSSVCKISVWERGEGNAHLPRECWLCLGRLKSGEGWMRSGEGEGEESVWGLGHRPGSLEGGVASGGVVHLMMEYNCLVIWFMFDTIIMKKRKWSEKLAISENQNQDPWLELPVLRSKDLVNGLTSISDGSRTWLCVELQYESGYKEQQYIHTLVYRIWCMNGECKWVWLCNITNTPHHEPQHFGLCIGACSVEKSTVTHDTHLHFSYGSMIDYSYVIKNYNVHWYNYTSGSQWTLVCNTTEVVIAYSICVYSDGGTVHVHQNSVLQTLHVKHEITRSAF